MNIKKSAIIALAVIPMIVSLSTPSFAQDNDPNSPLNAVIQGYDGYGRPTAQQAAMEAEQRQQAQMDAALQAQRDAMSQSMQQNTP